MSRCVRSCSSLSWSMDLSTLISTPSADATEGMSSPNDMSSSTKPISSPVKGLRSRGQFRLHCGHEQSSMSQCWQRSSCSFHRCCTCQLSADGERRSRSIAAAAFARRSFFLRRLCFLFLRLFLALCFPCCDGRSGCIPAGMSATMANGELLFAGSKS